jgi:membrane protein
VAVIPDESVRRQILDGLAGVKQQSGLFFLIGFAGLVWSGSNLFGTIEKAFAVIYHTAPRSFVRQKLMSVAMIFVFVVLAGLAVATSSLLPALERLPYVPGFLTKGPAGLLIQLALGVVSGCLLFGAILYVVPNRRQAWRQVWPGALLAGALFELLSLLFPLYLHYNKGLNQYGATFGLLFLLLTFFYLVGIITMLGVETNAVVYPVAVPQPDRAAALAPPGSGPEGEAIVRGPEDRGRGQAAGGRAAGGGAVGGAYPRRPERSRRRGRALTAVAVALAASLVGLLVGRRTAR